MYKFESLIFDLLMKTRVGMSTRLKIHTGQMSLTLTSDVSNKLSASCIEGVDWRIFKA